MVVDVIDLERLRIRNSFVLSGEAAPATLEEFAASDDGAECFVGRWDEITVVDSATGRIKQTARLELPEHQHARLGQHWVVGRDLLAEVVVSGEEGRYHYADPRSWALRGVWIRGGRAHDAVRGVVYAVVGGERRFATDRTGSRLYELNLQGAVIARRRLDRPELARLTKDEPYRFHVHGLAASPDGRYAILFIGESWSRC